MKSDDERGGMGGVIARALRCHRGPSVGTVAFVLSSSVASHSIFGIAIAQHHHVLCLKRQPHAQ